MTREEELILLREILRNITEAESMANDLPAPLNLQLSLILLDAFGRCRERETQLRETP